MGVFRRTQTGQSEQNVVRALFVSPHSGLAHPLPGPGGQPGLQRAGLQQQAPAVPPPEDKGGRDLRRGGGEEREAIFIVLFMVAIYFVYAYITANLVSIEPLRRKFFNDAQLSRFDAINEGMSVIANTYLMSLSSPWRKIAQNIDKHLLKKPSLSQNKFLKKYGKSTSQRSELSIDRMRKLN